MIGSFFVPVSRFAQYWQVWAWATTMGVRSFPQSGQWNTP